MREISEEGGNVGARDPPAGIRRNDFHRILV
jgi:hypothetical protein